MMMVMSIKITNNKKTPLCDTYYVHSTVLRASFYLYPMKTVLRLSHCTGGGTKAQRDWVTGPQLHS